MSMTLNVPPAISFQVTPGITVITVLAGPAAQSAVALDPGYPAGTALSGHRVVALVDGLAAYADPGAAAHKLGVIGITPGAVSAGEVVRPVLGGVMDEPSWNWVPRMPVYAGPNGFLTQSPPGTGWLRILGVAQSPTRLLVALREPITQGV